MMRTYKDIHYTLKRSQRKTASIYVERDGAITVMVPVNLPAAKLKNVLENKPKWIYKNLAEWHDLNATRVQREYVNGEGFLYLGRTYRLKLVAQQDVPLLFKDGHFCLRTDPHRGSRRCRVQGVLPGEGKHGSRPRGVLPGPWVWSQSRAGHGAETPLGVVLAGRRPELPLEAHDGPAHDLTTSWSTNSPTCAPNHTERSGTWWTSCCPTTRNARNGCA